MAKAAIIRTGGKQFLVRENDVIYVQKLDTKENDKIEFETLATFDEEAGSLDMGAPALKSTVAAEVVAQVKGEKVRVAKFKAKVRFRRVNGFRAQLTKVKIVKI